MTTKSNGNPIFPSSIPLQGENQEMWVHLGEESQITTIVLMETMQQLKADVARLRDETEQLMRDEERIIKILTD